MSIHEIYTGVYRSIHEIYTGVYRSIHKYTRVYMSIHEYTKDTQVEYTLTLTLTLSHVDFKGKDDIVASFLGLRPAFP